MKLEGALGLFFMRYDPIRDVHNRHVYSPSGYDNDLMTQNIEGKKGEIFLTKSGHIDMT